MGLVVEQIDDALEVDLGEENAARVTALRRTVESSPLYLTASRAAPATECRV